MRTSILILLVVAAAAVTLASPTPGKNGKSAQAGGRKKPTGQPISTTSAPSGLRTNGTRLNRMSRLRREAESEEAVVSEPTPTSTRKPKGGRNGHGKGKGKNGTAKAGGKRHNRNQRDLTSLLSQASSLFGGAAASGGKQPDLNALMAQAQSMLNSLGSTSQSQLNSMLQGSGMSSSDISALISQGSSMLSSLSSSSNGLLGNLTAQLQQLAVPAAGRKRRDIDISTTVEEQQGEEFNSTVEVEEISQNSTSEYYIDDYEYDQEFMAAAAQASDVVAAVMPPMNGTSMHGKNWWGNRQQNQSTGFFNLFQMLMSGDWLGFLMKVEVIVKNLLTQVLGIDLTNSVRIF